MPVETTHTPGPWRWCGSLLVARADQDPPKGEVILWPENVPSSADSSAVPWAQRLGSCGLRTEADAEANARLIEAAPDLLDALKKCAAVLAGEAMTKDSLIEALYAARAAIAKTKGAK